MRDLNDKLTGQQLSADEWNDVPSEMQNIITNAGITLSSTDLLQLAKAVSRNILQGNWYSPGGTANAITLTPVVGQPPFALWNGALFRFRPQAANTGNVTIAVQGQVAKNLLREDGGGVQAGDLSTSQDALVRYDSGSDSFILSDISRLSGLRDSAMARGQIDGFTIATGVGPRLLNMLPGAARDRQNNVTMSRTGTLTNKDLSANWSLGNSGGAKPASVTWSPNTWYHVFAISNASGSSVDLAIDTSVSGVTIVTDPTISGAGITAVRSIGSILTDSNSDIIQFRQVGDRFIWDQPILQTGPLGSTTIQDVILPSPPGLRAAWEGIVTLQSTQTTQGFAGQIRDDGGIFDTNVTFTNSDIDRVSSTQGRIFLQKHTDLNSTLRVKASGNNNTIRWVWNSHGFVHPRGKDNL